jgi:hypothetical protein
MARFSRKPANSIKPENLRQRLEVGKLHRPNALLPQLIEWVFSQRGASQFVILGFDVHKKLLTQQEQSDLMNARSAVSGPQLGGKAVVRLDVICSALRLQPGHEGFGLHAISPSVQRWFDDITLAGIGGDNDYTISDLGNYNQSHGISVADWLLIAIRLLPERAV